MSAMIVQTHTGQVCEPCIALNSGIDASYWEDDATGLARCERAAGEWAELGELVLTAVEEEPSPHFGGYCLVCGSMPYRGTVYDYTLTVFAR